MIGTRGLSTMDGGVERAVASLSRELAEAGHHITVYSRARYSHGDTCVSHERLRQVPLPCIATKHLEAISHSAIATAHATLSRRFDVVHIHAVGPALFSWLPRTLGIPTVVTIHALDWERQKWGRAAQASLRAGAWMATHAPARTIVVSKSIGDYVHRRYGCDAHYIRNGVDLQSDLPESPVPELVGAQYLLFLGRLVPEKGVHTLIRAFRQLDTPAKLAIVGDASHTEGYAAQLRALAADDPRICFLGSRYGGEKLWLLRNAAAFVQPSMLEGMPIALLEALSCGAAAVVSGIPANLEAIENFDGRTYVFPVEDQQALTTQLAAALHDSSPLDTLAGAVISAEHNWRVIARQTASVYSAAVAANA